jgi:hypothetical protein
MKNIKLLSIAAILLFTQQAFSQTDSKSTKMNNTTEHYTFPLSDKVIRKKLHLKTDTELRYREIYIFQKMLKIKN